MPKTEGLTPARHKKQIDAYAAQYDDYALYADALKRVLRKACGVSIPEAFVQTRPKSVSSFAEKCVRKAAKYKNPVKDMTDLCGGRVIVQTLEQVTAVRQFIEANFIVIEKDDKASLLGEHAFGYRDMHYLVQLDSKRDVGFTTAEKSRIGRKIAEIQVRTWLQHAWADTLHDRMYKTKLHYPAEFERMADMLAAKMEDGDQTFSRLALEIDGMLANYSVHASKAEVDAEIRMLEQILLNEPNDSKKPAVAVQLARLIMADGNYGKVVSILEPYANEESAIRCEILLLLGYALCKVHLKQPQSKAYRRGQECLKTVIGDCESEHLKWVPNLRKRKSLRARAYAHLAWSWETVPDGAHTARDCYREALAGEPDNPYFLADVLGFEVTCTGSPDFIECMEATLRKAITTCREHICNGTELPYACFVAGRLCLLLNDAGAALTYYSRGIRHFLSGAQCVPDDLLKEEQAWILRVAGKKKMSSVCSWAHELLGLAQRTMTTKAGAEDASSRTLILAGGVKSLSASAVRKAHPMLEQGLARFEGTVISGGTNAGLPGCVGSAAARLKSARRKRFELVGYVPTNLPHDAPKDRRYDRHVICGESGFSPEQVLRMWTDLLNQGVRPADVQVLGFGGGEISSAEYNMALALGATVGVVTGTGGAADAILDDCVWTGVEGLLALPFDPTTVQCFIVPATTQHASDVLDGMGRAFHERYVADSASQLPPNLKPWDDLADTYKAANREQAHYATVILESCGFTVREVKTPKIFTGFTDDEIECMAEMEHGRWNVERLRNGWRPGEIKDPDHKVHNCIVPWKDLPASIKHYDRNAVKDFPTILAKAGLEVRRKRAS